MELTEGDVFQSAIPYFTSTGVHTNPLVCLAAGSHLVLEPEFDQHRTLPVADAFRSTVYLGGVSTFCCCCATPTSVTARHPCGTWCSVVPS